MNDIDAKLTNAEGAWRDRDIGRDGWTALGNRAVELLASKLGRALALDPPRASFRESSPGFSVWVRERCTPGPADVAMRAIVGANFVKHGLLVRAWLFYYVGHRRVAPVLDETEYPGAEYRNTSSVAMEFLNADLIADADGRPVWELGLWDTGFTADEFGDFQKW